MLAGVFRSVIDGPLRDPFADESDLLFGERRVLFRHLRFALIVGGDLLDEQGVLRIAGDDSAVGFGPCEERLEGGHNVVALGLGGLMTAVALRLEEEEDFLVLGNGAVGSGSGVADLVRPILRMP
jgi:hypothetical protein